MKTMLLIFGSTEWSSFVNCHHKMVYLGIKGLGFIEFDSIVQRVCNTFEEYVYISIVFLCGPGLFVVHLVGLSMSPYRFHSLGWAPRMGRSVPSAPLFLSIHFTILLLFYFILVCIAQ